MSGGKLLTVAEVGAVCPCPLRLDHLAQSDNYFQDNGYVYVMGIWDRQDQKLGDLVKVGLSNDPRYRLCQIHREILATDEGWRATPFLYLTIAVSNMPRVERRAHMILARRREWGEWFACSPKRAALAVMAAERSVGKPHRPMPKEWLEEPAWT